MSKDKITTNQGSIKIRFTAWITKLVKRAKIDYIRSEKHSKGIIPLDSVPEEDLPSVEQPDLTFVSVDKFGFGRDDLAKAFSRLSATRQKILIMQFVQEKSVEEIADELGCTVQNIYNQRSISLRQLRAMMGENKND